MREAINAAKKRQVPKGVIQELGSSTKWMGVGVCVCVCVLCVFFFFCAALFGMWIIIMFWDLGCLLVGLREAKRTITLVFCLFVCFCFLFFGGCFSSSSFVSRDLVCLVG